MIVIFDLDGTLIDSAPHIHWATSQALKARGLAPLDLPQIKSFVGRGLPNLVAQVLDRLGAADPVLAADLTAEIEALYLERLELNIPYPGAIDALDRLTEMGASLGICTNKPIAPTRAVLDHLGLTTRFSSIIGGDSLPVRKPDPAPLRAAIAACGAGPVAYVGDSEVDAETAQAAGLPFLLYTEGYRKTPLDALPHSAAFSDYAELPELAARFAG